jgi:predicted  nucleic acid-binding Zn-ribbon protein
VEQNQIFQTAYKETRKCKSAKILANGYLARYPTRRQLLSEEYQYHVRQDAALMDAFSKLQERIEAQEAEREIEREEHRRQMEEMLKSREADREALRQEFMSMMQAAQGQASLQQVIVM